jgi:hypothetical protein
MKYNKVEHILEEFQGMDIQIFDGYDNCAIGYDFDGQNVRIIYSVSKMIKAIMKEYKYSELEAIEDFEFNFRGFRSGDANEPIFCQDDF